MLRAARSASARRLSLFDREKRTRDVPVLDDELDALGEEALQELALAALVQALEPLLAHRLAEHVDLGPVQSPARRALELESRLGEDERVRDARRDGRRERAAEEGLGRRWVLAVLGRDEGALERRKGVERDGRVDRLRAREDALELGRWPARARSRGRGRTRMTVLEKPLQNPAMPCSSKISLASASALGALPNPPSSSSLSESSTGRLSPSLPPTTSCRGSLDVCARTVIIESGETAPLATTPARHPIASSSTALRTGGLALLPLLSGADVVLRALRAWNRSRRAE